MTLQLRPYQTKAVADLRAAYQRGHLAPCLVMPTGAGKAVVAAAIVSAAVIRGTRILFVANRNTLLDQILNKFAAAGVTDVRVIQAQRDDGPPDALVTVASAQTIRMPKWMDRMPQADLVIWDECHGVVARTYDAVLQRYPSSRRLGLTATPSRGDNKPLAAFDVLVMGPSVSELVALSHLARPRVLPPPEGALEDGELALEPVVAYQRHAAGRRAAVFCLQVEQATKYAAGFTSAGIAAEVVTAGTRDRAGVLARFAAGEFPVLVSVGCLTEGWDCPIADVAIIARRPSSVGLWLQICGRVLRPYPGKDEGLILDLGGAYWEYGPPDLPREFSLDGKAISSVIKDSLAQCRQCGSGFLVGPKQCPYCGAELPVRPARMPRVAGVGLVDAPLVVQRAWVSALKAKYPGHCAKCGRWFPPGEPIYSDSGKRNSARHQRCPLPALPSVST